MRNEKNIERGIMIDLKDRILSNGMRVITIKNNSSLMSASVGIKCGSMYDEPHLKGISHFLEHILFTGTNKRSHDDINNDLELLAGDSNAYTDFLTTTFSVTALDTEFESSLDILSDILINSVISKEETKREKGVILSEFLEGQEDIENISFNKLYKEAFKNNPLRLSVIGTEETIKNITHKDLINHYKKYYVPNNSIIVVSSKFEHDYMEKLIEYKFGEWKPNFNLTLPKIEDVVNESIDIKTNITGFDMGTISIYYSFFDLPKNLYLALRILNYKLGSSDNSLLFKEVRLKRGLAYDIYSDLDLSPHSMNLEIYCATNKENLELVRRTIFNEIEKIRSRKVLFTVDMLSLMKKIQRTHIAHLLDNPSGLNEYILENALEDNKLLKYEDDLVELDRMQIEDIYKAFDIAFKNPAILELYPGDTDDNNKN